MLLDLRNHYDRHGIGALDFRCTHAGACRGAGGRFTEAKESFVGTEYEKGTLPRLLFVSLDSGSGDADPSRRTLEFTRRSIEADDVEAFPKGRHWYVTHEMCWVLLRQFKPDLTVGSTPPYFAHVNSAKCCQNNPGRSEAADVLFDNCRPFIREEICILRPEVIVTQGGRARQVIEGAFRIQREMSMGSCRAHVILCGEREALWIHTHHPSGYGHFWRQKNDCWEAFASLVGMFAAREVPISSRPTGSTVPATPRLVKAAGGRLAGTPVRPAPAPPVHGTIPASLEELITASRAVTSSGSFERFVARMRALPGPSHQHIGLFSGMRVQQFQNWQLDHNPRYRLTDAQLLAVMRAEFPQATGKVFSGSLEEGLAIVRGIRAHYNRDGHNGPAPEERGMLPSVSFGKF